MFLPRYIWTPAMVEELRRAYALRRAERSAALNGLQVSSGFPRHVLIDQAGRMGISSERKRWTPAEDRVIAMEAGEKDIARVAARLGRTRESVKLRAVRLGASIRVRADYSVADLMEIFGEGRRRIREWIERGLLGSPANTNAGVRVRDGALVAFINDHIDVYSFRRADETFVKGVLHGSREGLSGEAAAGVARGGQEKKTRSRRHTGSGGLQIAGGRERGRSAEGSARVDQQGVSQDAPDAPRLREVG